MAKLTLNDIPSGFFSATAYNTNNGLIETALENTLSRDGTTPNTMGANLDMNSNRIVNLPEPLNDNEAARLVDVQNAISGATTANLISFTPAGTIAATNVQAAIEELDNDNAATVTVADAAADTTTWPLLATSQTGNLTPATDAGITYNASTNVLTTTGGVTTSALAVTGGSKFRGEQAADFSSPNVTIWTSGGVPGMSYVDSAQVADSRTVEWLYTGGVFVGRYINDAHSAITNWVSVVGSSASISSIIFGGLVSLGPVGQLKFPGTQNPSADVNTLDDYKEGTWTPVLTFATPGDLAVTYAVRQGYYTKIGNLVTVDFFIQTSAFTHTTAAGQAIISGLPVASGIAAYNPIFFNGITKAGYTTIAVSAGPAGTSLGLSASGSGVGFGQVNAADIPTGGTVILIGQLSYRV